MSVYSDAVLADTPGLYWRLGDSVGSGTVADASGNGRTGTPGSGVTLGVSGLLAADADTAASFDGTANANIASTYSAFAGARTFEGWATLADATARAIFTGTGFPTPYLVASTTAFSFSPNWATVASQSWSFALAGTFHWALTYDNATRIAELFVNGASQGTKTYATGYGGAPGTLSLNSNSGDPRWSGKQDEFAIYTAILSPARVLAHYTAGIPVPPIPPQIHVREKPPLRSSVDIETPAGRHYRWADDEPNPANVPSGLRYSDTIPGGHETGDCTLPRKPGIDYADLERLSDMRVLGVGGEPYWGGRLERAPRTSGDEVSVSPSAVGHVALLDDNKSASMVYLSRDGAGWTDASLSRQVNLISLTRDIGNGSVASARDDATNPGLIATLTNVPFTKPQVETWFDAGAANRIAQVRLQSTLIGFGLPDALLDNLLGASADDSASAPATYDLKASNGSPVTITLTTARRFVFLSLFWNSSAGGTAGTTYGARYQNISLVGDHGLTLHGADYKTDGLYASDIVRHAVQTWAPKLQVKSDSVQQSSFVIPHLTFLDATTAGEIVKQASRFDLPDWGVWDDKEFVWHQPGARGRTWRLRIGPSQLEETGKSVERLWESIIVSYSDVDGSTRTVGPPGSGANTESSDLKDSDPDNPANKLGIVRRDLLQMGTSTAAGATEVGRRFLLESKLLDRSGKARVVGWAEDDRGVLHPFSAIRSGDYCVFVDASDTSARKVIRTDKDHDSRTCSLDLDAPPEGLQQLLERLGVVLQPLGVS